MDNGILCDSRQLIRLFRQMLLALILISAIYSYPAYANRVSDKIYNVLQSNHYCSRRLNSTHQMGCSSELGGNFGVVWIVEDNNDLEHIIETGPTPPYMAILRREYYTRKNLLKFKTNVDRVAGVVFLDDSHADSRGRIGPFSPEDRCPNRHSGLYMNDTQYSNCKRNFWLRDSQISGLLYDDIPFPIFLINETRSIDEIESCFSNNNVVKDAQKIKRQDAYPLCSMQLDSFMLATSETDTCLNSRSLVDELFQTYGRRCGTVSNENIFAYYKPTYGPAQLSNKTDLLTPGIVEPQSVVLLIAKLSSLSMFTDLSPGADSTIVPMVTILAIAQALIKHRNDTEVVGSSRNIAFALLDSEPFDYTGSSRMVHDMQKSSFPFKYYKSKDSNIVNTMKNINLESLDYVINLDQLAKYPNSSKIYLHTDPLSENSDKFEQVSKVLSATAARQKIDFKRADRSLPLPPTSVHEFIKGSKQSSSTNKLLGLVLSNYGETYENLFYNSIYDDSHNVYQTSKENLVEHITQVAGFVAKGIFELAFKKQTSDNIVIDEKLVSELLECYLVDAECALFTRACQAGQKLPGGPIQTYKDPTKKSDDINGIITANLLAYFLGDIMNGYNLTKCHEESRSDQIYFFDYLNGNDEPIQNTTSGVCIRSQVFRQTSESPAFDEDEEGTITVDRRYPAWTVSLNSIRYPVRIFIKPSPVHQWCVFLLGIVVTLMAFITVYHLRGSISQLRIESDLQQGTST